MWVFQRRPFSNHSNKPAVSLNWIEIEQQKEKKQKKDPEEKSTLQRSKTFVNLLFKGGRKKDTSKSPGDKSGKGSVDGLNPTQRL